MKYLLFRLYGPMASWGEIAVGQSRHTAGYPGKSAILGLLAAAMGVRRTDVKQQTLLQQQYNLAVEVFSNGNLLLDFHTTQVPDNVGKFSYRTRRDELIIGKGRLGTMLSNREYRTDSLAVAAVKALDDAPFELSFIQQHLQFPRFHLYLGRKSCPLAAPLNPQIITAAGYFEAFGKYVHKPILPFHRDSEEQLSRRDRYWIGVFDERHYYWEGDRTDFSDILDLSQMQTRIRRDQPLSRSRWQFVPRQEHYLYMAGGD